MAPLDNTQRSEGTRDGGDRIAKVIARSGLCSRRDAEAWIAAGRVAVNGAIVETPALDIGASDRVLVDGKPLPQREPPRVWRYYKPKGRVTTHKDPEGRPTVFEALPEGLPRLISVGRLDFNTEGLLLLTNDGDLARHLELPSTGWTRRYRVRAHGEVEQSALDALADGLTMGRVHYGPIEAALEREQGGNVWIALSIREGKNREVRRVMEHLGLTVNRLIRVSFGPFMLGDLEPGQIEEVKTRVLRDQLGPRLSRELGVRREPIREERTLPPSHSRPTYLRRKSQTTPASRTVREAEEETRPLRRRILPMDGASGEPAKSEFVERKRPRKFERFRGGNAGSTSGDRPREERAPKNRGFGRSSRESRHEASGTSHRSEHFAAGEKHARNAEGRSSRSVRGRAGDGQRRFDTERKRDPEDSRNVRRSEPPREPSFPREKRERRDSGSFHAHQRRQGQKSGRQEAAAHGGEGRKYRERDGQFSRPRPDKDVAEKRLRSPGRWEKSGETKRDGNRRPQTRHGDDGAARPRAAFSSRPAHKKAGPSAKNSGGRPFRRRDDAKPERRSSRANRPRPEADKEVP